MTQTDSSGRIQELGETVVSSENRSTDIGALQHPAQIGRYRILEFVGKGGYGIVYLAFDEELKRQVAVKVPHPNFVSHPNAATAYLAEARTVANLDHPNIVPVYDIGKTADYPCFIVSKFIKGTNLAEKMKQARLTYTRSAELVATVADALDYAHRQRLVHRDIKPGNMLLDEEGSPWLADFGLALREQDVGHGKRYVGTAFYMSPEQARGEGHRVDSRSDIFSLGIVFYELLAGQRPFFGSSREEILRRIMGGDAPPLRRIESAVPRELARICQKAMARRVSERYASARDLAQELRNFLGELATGADPSASTGKYKDDVTIMVPGDSARATGLGDTKNSWDTNPVARFVPKGLRAFDEHDADFFLDLLPGPRDRDGLPDGVRFWKHRVGQTNPDQTFPVGVIYGPSGCGKSSLVKAGLLPRLDDNVCAVYVEATAAGTESRLLRLIASQIPDLRVDQGLKKAFAAVRRGEGLPAHKKLLIVIDQFEQWLHAHQDVERSQLLAALRQCDGGRVQCIVMVRDEFWLAVSRFARALEISVDDGHNSALVDLFDQQHAQKVLAAFGVAYGKLPELAGQMSDEQKMFLKQAVAGLARDGRVSCIQLSLLADMMKGKSWTTERLQHEGGTLGIGESFLEETFSSSSAPPSHRYHEPAARAVLKSLLPERGTDIKGQMKSREELRQLCGYANRPKDFQELIKILDTELRLISPIDTCGIHSSDASKTSDSESREYYQLTHDYLVHSLWQWLTRKQKESRRGRAEIRLAERSALWNAKPESRQLPSFWEYLHIRFFTRPWQWSQQERRLLRVATRYHLAHKIALLVVLLAVGVASWRFLDSVHTHQAEVEKELQQQEAINRAVALVQQLRDASTNSVPEIANELASWRPWADPILADGFRQAADDSRQKLHLAIALMSVDKAGVEYVTVSLPDLQGEQFDVALKTLLPHKEIAGPVLWRQLEDSRLDRQKLLSTAIALASLSPQDERWNPLLTKVAKQLTKVASPAEYLARLGSVAPQLAEPLRDILNDESLPHAERWRAAAALCGILSVEQQIAEALPDAIVQWILETNDPDEFQSLLAALRPHSYGVQRRMETVLGQSAEVVTPLHRLNAATVLLRLGKSDKVWPLLRHSPDPTFRNQLVDRLTQYGAGEPTLATQLDDQEDPSIRQAIVLVLGGDRRPRAAGAQDQITNMLRRLYKTDPDAGVHAAIDWALRGWQMDADLAEMDAELSGQYESDFNGRHDWKVNRLGQTYIRVSPATEFLMGDTSRGKPLRSAKIDYSFAIAAKEVTVAEFKMFRKQHVHDVKHAPDMNCPVNDVSWYDAVAFCNWLSDKEGLTRCYEPNAESEYAAGVRIPADILQRNGYRLPTELELECLSRAGTVTRYSFGDSRDLLGNYGWYEKNANNRTWPVGSKMPNVLGAFDTHGNLWEWSHDLRSVADRATDRIAVDGGARLLCGGAFDNPHSRVESGDRLVHYPHEYKYSYGFRPARTLSPNPEP